MTHIRKEDINGCASRHNAVKTGVTLPSGKTLPPDIAQETRAVPVAAKLTELQTAINAMETLFSGNCDCLTNTNCCQTCQGCQSSVCQSCQSCQRQCRQKYNCSNCSNCNCNCGGDCSQA